LKRKLEWHKHDENRLPFFVTWHTGFLFQILTKIKTNFKFFKRSSNKLHSLDDWIKWIWNSKNAFFCNVTHYVSIHISIGRGGNCQVRIIKKNKLKRKKTKWRTKSRWPPSMNSIHSLNNFYANQLKLEFWKERLIKEIA
jgi:hypothetical protein